jgi:hypothetical protein
VRFGRAGPPHSGSSAPRASSPPSRHAVTAPRRGPEPFTPLTRCAWTHRRTGPGSGWRVPTLRAKSS